MFGYVVPDKPELKVREYELYSGYYCGLCKSVKRRYGKIPSIFLNYDFVFLSLLLGGLNDSLEKIGRERCHAYPLKKRTVVHGEEAIDYAADMMLLLSYHKLLDDKRDEGGIKPLSGLLLLKRTYKKIMKKHGEKGIIVRERLRELDELEKNNCSSLDRAAEPFAKLMEEIFKAEALTDDKEALEKLGIMGYHLGKWIYLIDAFDDIDKNAEEKTYNPLLVSKNFQGIGDDFGLFKNQIRDRVEFNLMYYLSELSKAFEEVGIKRNKELLDNVVYLGLLRKTEEILTLDCEQRVGEGNTKDAESL
jgi:hypothetical protein